MSKDRTRPRLGRGLSSLLSLSEIPEEEASGGTETDAGDQNRRETSLPIATADDMSREGGTAGLAVLELPVDAILPNPHQPRRDFKEASLAELAASLKSTGLVQPIVVRKTAAGYELIAGERRLRAAKLAGLTALPAIVKEVDGPTQAQMALVENIQREDLNPVDRALAYQSLLANLGLTQAELAGRLGEDRSSIAHHLRLLELAESVREKVRAGTLTLGHAKLLGRVADQARQLELAERIVAEDLSVRACETILSATPPSAAKSPSKPVVGSAAHLKDLEQTFTRHLGMQVQIKASASVKGRGRLIIQYKNLDEFDALKERLGVEIE